MTQNKADLLSADFWVEASLHQVHDCADATVDNVKGAVRCEACVEKDLNQVVC